MTTKTITIKYDSEINKLRALRGFIEIDDKEMFLKDMFKKRKERRY